MAGSHSLAHNIWKNRLHNQQNMLYTNVSWNTFCWGTFSSWMWSTVFSCIGVASSHLFSWRFFENDCCKENQTDFTIKFFLELIYIGSYLSTSFIKLFVVEFFVWSVRSFIWSLLLFKIWNHNHGNFRYENKLF